jgi:pentatricopeptide repeat protein
MEHDGCEQTVYTFTILISELFRVHKNEEALKMWDLMIDKGITPNVACFRALSIGLCLSGKVARACKVLDELAPMGVVLETAYEDMIGALCKAGRVKEACKLADGIVDRGREIPGKIRTVMIHSLRKAGNVDLAIKLMHSKIGIGYERMRSVKKRVKFQTLVDG